MNLLLIRHAKAEDHGHAGGDAARALTEKGREQSRKVGLFLKAQGLVPDLVLCSPLVRARETAEILCREAGLGAPMVERWLACGMHPEQALQELAVYQGTMKCVAIVGHEPDISGLVGHLLGVQRGYVQVKKASVILMAVHPPRGGGVLEFCVWPGMMPG